MYVLFNLKWGYKWLIASPLASWRGISVEKSASQIHSWASSFCSLMGKSQLTSYCIRPFFLWGYSLWFHLVFRHFKPFIDRIHCNLSFITTAHIGQVTILAVTDALDACLSEDLGQKQKNRFHIIETAKLEN